ncbi:MAG: ATP-binding protein [Gluconacetobacter liquefaciens]
MTQSIDPIDPFAGVRAAVDGADRQFQVIEGGRGGSDDGPPPEADGQEAKCPVVALGHLDGIFFFLDIAGQLRSLSAGEMTRRGALIALFGGIKAWLMDRFPKKTLIKKKGRDGQEQSEEITVDFKINDAAEYLQRECFEAGLYGDHILIRRPGVWPDVEGMPIVHCGDRVLIGAKLQPIGTRTGNQIWAAASPSPIPRPPCGPEVATLLQGQLQELWNFRVNGAAIAVMGLLACSYYGAAIPWRPAGFLTGGAGCGKSSLLAVLRGAAPLHFYTNDTSKAGLEQSLDGRAMPMFIDEASDREDQRGARALLDMVLSASGGEGTKGSRGGVDGRARKIEVAGSIIMASISPPDMKPQHLGRFTIIELTRPAAGADHSAEHKALVQWAKDNGGALWGRALAGWDRYREAVKRFRDAIGKAGCAPREMDQLGALLSGWWVLTRDGIPTLREAETEAESLREYMRQSDEVVSQDAPTQMVNHLMSRVVQLNRSTERKPVRALIGHVLDDRPNQVPDVDALTKFNAVEILAQYGMRVIRPDDLKNKRGSPTPRMADGAGVWFSPANSMLRDMFSDTPFVGNRWVFELGRLESARQQAKPVQISKGQVQRGCWWVSAEELGFNGDDDD